MCKVFLGKFDDDGCFPLLLEYSNVWAMDKDGKKWFDVTQFPEYMRK